jgi:hypothetical protein
MPKRSPCRCCARQAIDRNPQTLVEIARLDAELEAARDTSRARDEALETERPAHEQTKSDAREAEI